MPAYFYWYFRIYAVRIIKVPLTDTTFIREYKPGLISKMRMFPHLSKWLAYSMLILALARPVQVTDSEKIINEGTDFMILLDVSESMEKADVMPNRLSAAQLIIENFLAERKGDRVGIILFSEEAFSYFPLTWDLSLIKSEVSRITTEILPRQGTALGSAIALSITHFHDNQSSRPVMLILTDGANNRGAIAPLTAARLAARADIRIYSMIVGSEVPEFNISTSSDTTALEYISQITGGKTFHIPDPRIQQQVFDEISALESTQSYQGIKRNTHELYPYFLQLALILFVVTYLLMVIGINNPLEY